MSRMNLSTQDLFLRLGATPRTRTVKADQLFRKLRADDSVDVQTLLTKAPRAVTVGSTFEARQFGDDNKPSDSTD